MDNVGSIDAQFDVSDRTHIELELTQAASKDALAKARNMAESLGASIGSLYSVSQESYALIEGRFGLSSESVTHINLASPVSSQESIFVPATINIRTRVNVIHRLSIDR